MALADSVPGVSGGTIAFILGFYDRFLDALHQLFGKDKDCLLYTSLSSAVRMPSFPV